LFSRPSSTIIYVGAVNGSNNYDPARIGREEL